MISPARPAISVVMSVYNAERYVSGAIASILGQSFGDFEFLILDDGSTDGSAAVIAAHAWRDPRIRVISR
jgi:glycosyltransferase involved in cell wall biosynthesis